MARQEPGMAGIYSKPDALGLGIIQYQGCSAEIIGIVSFNLTYTLCTLCTLFANLTSIFISCS
jgi:hypothetical protein